MYIIVLTLLLGGAAAIFFQGLHAKKTGRIVAGLCIAAATVLFFWFLDFWAQALWFEALGFADRFWTVVITKLVLLTSGIVVGVAAQYLLLAGVTGKFARLKWIAVVLGAFFAGRWGWINWDKFQQTSQALERLQQALEQLSQNSAKPQQ